MNGTATTKIVLSSQHGDTVKERNIGHYKHKGATEESNA